MAVKKDQGGIAEITGVYEGKQGRFARPGDKFPEMQGVDRSEKWVLKQRYTESGWVVLLVVLVALLALYASGTVVVEPTAAPPPPVPSSSVPPPARPPPVQHARPPITYWIPHHRVRSRPSLHRRIRRLEPER